MPIILKSDREKYINQKDIKTIKRTAGAIYLPKGDGFISDLFTKIVSNKEGLKTIGDLATSGINSASTLVGTVTKAVKDGEEIKALKLQNDLRSNDLKQKLLSRTGQGFYFI